MKYRSFRILLIIVFSHAALPGFSGAAEVRPTAGGETALKTLRVGLDQFSKYKSVELKTISTSFPINFPIPDRWRVDSVRLNLHYVNSVTLIHDQSQLTVSVNGHAIGQTRLNPARPDGVLAMDVPVGRLAPGYNTLNFSVAQHYQDSCEQWDSPNLWTSLDLEGSYLEIRYSDRPLPANLSEAADFMFDPKSFPHGEVNVVADVESSASLEAAGIAASGVARRFGYKKVVFTASADVLPGRDNVLVGAKEFVEAAAARAGAALTVDGALLQVMRLPLGQDEQGRTAFDPTRGLIVAAGTTPEEVKRSALFLAGMSIPLPGSDRTLVKDVALPPLQPYSGPDLLEAGREYAFKSMGFRTHTFRKVNPLATDIDFRLPNDYRIEPNKYMTLVLNYIYGPGMQEASSLTVSVNQEVARTIPLDKLTGDFIAGYRIDLPTYLFRPGLNTLTFTSYLNPKGGNCEMIMPDSYFMTLYENSTLRFPGMAHFVRLPDVRHFVDDGFPYTRWRDGRECEIFITRPDYGLLGAAFNVLGFISQKCEHALLAGRVRVGTPGPAGPSDPEKELIVLGSADSLPAGFFEGAPLRLGVESVSSHPAAPWKEPDFTVVHQTGGIDPRTGLIMAFQSPAKHGRSLMLFTASTPAQVAKLSRLLLSPSISAQLKGAAIFVDLEADEDNKVTPIDTQEGYWTGKLGLITPLTYFLYVYPYTNYLLAILLILLAALAATFFLARLRRRRLALAQGKSPRR